MQANDKYGNSITSESEVIGLVANKQRAIDESGWVILDGRPKSALSPTQQTNANLLGYGINIPKRNPVYIPVIPALASANGLDLIDNSAISVSANSEYSASYAAYKACDGYIDANEWAGAGLSNSTNAWFKVTLSANRIIKRIKATGRVGSPTERFISSVLEASNDGTNWTLLANVGDMQYNVQGIISVDLANNITGYTQIRLRNTGAVTSPHNLGLAYFQIYEIDNTEPYKAVYLGL